MIELRNVSAGYDGKDVIHDISLTMEPGRVTAIVGPNGCGKSTLLKSVIGIAPHTAGDILVNGIPTDRLTSVQLARQAAYLPQSRRVPDISVLRMVLHGRFPYLTYPRRYRPEDMEAARRALRWAGLEGLEQKNVSRLSGGMQQKVYIAMALAQETDSILMDEPTTFLDIAHQLRTMETARQLAAGGKAVVMVLHDISQALRTADTVAVMQEGRLLQTGSPEEIYAGGTLAEVFGVRICRHQTGTGWHYFCEETIH